MKLAVLVFRFFGFNTDRNAYLHKTTLNTVTHSNNYSKLGTFETTEILWRMHYEVTKWKFGHKMYLRENKSSKCEEGLPSLQPEKLPQKRPHKMIVNEGPMSLRVGNYI